MPLTRYTLRQLEAFTTVAEVLSFSVAGERMGLTAQAVSQLVGDFEGVLGFRVFDRTTRRVALSSAGRDFLSSAESVLRHVQSAEQVAYDVRNRAAGVVRVAAPLVLAATALPTLIHDYAQRHPKVVIRVRDCAVDGLVEAVEVGDVDLAIGPDRSVDARVERLPVFDSPWVLWCASSHPLAAHPSLRWTDLRDVRLVAAGRDHERSVAQMHLSAPEGTRISPVDIVDNISTALGIAAQGLAVTLAPAYVRVLARTFGLEMRHVLEPEAVRMVCLYRAVERKLSPAAEGFAGHLTQSLPAWAQQVSQQSH